MFRFGFILKLESLNKYLIILVSYFMLSQSSPHKWDLIIKKSTSLLKNETFCRAFVNLLDNFILGRWKREVKTQSSKQQNASNTIEYKKIALNSVFVDTFVRKCMEMPLLSIDCGCKILIQIRKIQIIYR